MNDWAREGGTSLFLQLPVRNKKPQAHGITLGTEPPLTSWVLATEIRQGQAVFSQREAKRQVHSAFWAPGERRLSEDHTYCGLVLLGHFHAWWHFFTNLYWDQAEPWHQEAAAV